MAVHHPLKVFAAALLFGIGVYGCVYDIRIFFYGALGGPKKTIQYAVIVFLVALVNSLALGKFAIAVRSVETWHLMEKSFFFTLCIPRLLE